MKYQHTVTDLPEENEYPKLMNDDLAKKLIRQLKILNVWISLLGSIIVIALIVLAILLWQVIGFIRETNAKIESVKTQASDSLNVKKQVCGGDGGISEYIKDATDICL